AALRLDPKRAASLYGRGLAKSRKGDVGPGNKDIAAATTIRSDVADLFTKLGDDFVAGTTTSSAGTAPPPPPPPAPPAVVASTQTSTGSIPGSGRAPAPEPIQGVTSGEFHRRVALVIGNSSYANVVQLRNPRNDAADVAAALRKLGFEVVEGLDLSRRGTDEPIRD